MTNVTVKKKRFIEALTAHGTVYHAAQAAGVSRWTAYRWRDNDPAFAQAWKDALEDCADIMESSVYKRGLAGDSILSMFWLKAHRPEFRDRVSVDVKAVQAEIAQLLQHLVAGNGLPPEMRVLQPAARLLEAPKPKDSGNGSNS